MRQLNTPKHSFEDSKSLNIWAQVVLGPHLTELCSDDGYDLIKLLIEKLWLDCTTSLARISLQQVFDKQQKLKKE